MAALPFGIPENDLYDPEKLIVKPEISQITKQISICGQEMIPKARGYSAILNVATDSSYEPPPGVEYRKVGLSDDGRNDCDQIDRAVDTLHELIQQGKRVLVHCRAGVSRSPSVVAAYLAKYQGHTFNSALEVVKNGRSIADPRHDLWATFLMCNAKNKF